MGLLGGLCFAWVLFVCNLLELLLLRVLLLSFCLPLPLGGFLVDCWDGLVGALCFGL